VCPLFVLFVEGSGSEEDDGGNSHGTTEHRGGED